MKSVIYLVFRKHGVTRMTKCLPRMESGEYAIKVTLEVSDKVFQRSIPSAEVKVPEEYLIEPPIPVVTVEQPPKIEEKPAGGAQG